MHNNSQWGCILGLSTSCHVLCELYVLGCLAGVTLVAAAEAATGLHGAALGITLAYSNTVPADGPLLPPHHCCCLSLKHRRRKAPCSRCAGHRQPWAASRAPTSPAAWCRNLGHGMQVVKCLCWLKCHRHRQAGAYVQHQRLHL